MERLVQVRACPWAKTDEGGGERHVPAERLDFYGVPYLPTFQLQVPQKQQERMQRYPGRRARVLILLPTRPSQHVGWVTLTQNKKADVRMCDRG